MSNQNQPNPLLALLGGGMAKTAGQQVQQMPDYKMYVSDVQAMGQQPLPMNDPNWIKHYQQLMQPQQQQPPQGLLGP